MSIGRISRVGSLLLLGAVVPVWGCHARRAEPPLPVVSHVDLERYQGVWYEIARYPHKFEEGCVAVTATYRLRQDGKVDVRNECREGSPDGPLRVAEGTARVADPQNRAKLEVTFFWPFYGDYWILALGPEYEYAMVGAPSREYLWILSRTPQMDDELYRRLTQRARELGFDPAHLLKTPQPEGEAE